jgi:hypothetical protein
MIRGQDDYVFLKYAKEYNEVFEEDVFNIDLIEDITSFIKARTIILEVLDSQGTGFFVTFNDETFLITSTHVVEVEGQKEYYSNICSDLDSRPIYIKHPLSIQFEKDIFWQKMNTSCKRYKLEEDFQYNPGTKVQIIGYPDDVSKGGDHSCINTEILKESVYNGISYLQVSASVKNGMSGGPVLNSNRKVIGVLYCGNLSEKSAVNGFVPFTKKLFIDYLQNEDEAM